MAKQTTKQHKTPPKLPSTKLDQIVAALRARKGATIDQLVTLTGWQAHSVRGAMSGALKKQRGFSITSTKSGSERIYKIEGAR
jgi:hypothetical protein